MPKELETMVKTETVNEVKENQQVEAETKETKQEKTFTRDQLNSYIAVEVKKAREEERKRVEEEVKAKAEEAERLAKLSEEEKSREILSAATKRAESAEAKLNSYVLKDKTLLENSDLPTELISLIDFDVYNTEDKVAEKVKTIREVYTKSLEKGVNKALKEKTPKSVAPNGNAQATYTPDDLTNALHEKFSR